MDDSYLDLGDLTQEKDLTFRPEIAGYRPMEVNELSLLGISYEMDLDMISYDRRIYSVLDLVSDVGGLAGALFAAVRIICLVLRFYELEWYLVSKLYTKNELRKD